MRVDPLLSDVCSRARALAVFARTLRRFHFSCMRSGFAFNSIVFNLGSAAHAPNDDERRLNHTINTIILWFFHSFGIYGKGSDYFVQSSSGWLLLDADIHFNPSVQCEQTFHILRHRSLCACPCMGVLPTLNSGREHSSELMPTNVRVRVP